MCNCWKEKTDHLNSADIIGSLKQLHGWLGSNFLVHIAGGESLVFDGIYDIFAFCADNGIVCKASTNGINLTDKICDKLIHSRLQYLSISIDSHLPEIHDRFRGVEGTLGRCLRGIQYLAVNGDIKLGISSIIMKDNVDTLCDSVDFFLKLPIHRLLMQPIRVWTEALPPDRWREYEYWVRDIDALERFTKYLLAMKKEEGRIFNSEKDIKEWLIYFTNPISLVEHKKKNCTIGYDRLIINYRGEIYLGCEFFDSIGNIKRDNPEDSWKSFEARRIRQQMKQCEFPCTNNCYKELSLLEKVERARVMMGDSLFERRT